MKNSSSKTTSSTDPAICTAGDVAAALSLAGSLRAQGFAPTRIKVGDVEFDLGQSQIGVMPSVTTPILRSIVEEYGGPEMARLLKDQPDLVDDEDQPAVRS